jgi:hypothetical protein
MMFSATCSGCGAEIVTTLASDPSVPVYACSFAGTSHARLLRHARSSDDPVRAGGKILHGGGSQSDVSVSRPGVDRNLTPLEPDDILDVLIIIGQASEATGVRIGRVRR